MKKVILALVAVAACLSANAQGPQMGGGNKMAMPSTEMMVNKQVEDMTKQLSLTEEQQAKVREILTDQINYEKQVRQLLEQNRSKAEEQIQNVLTDEQKTKRAEQFKHPRGMRHGGPGGPGGMRPEGPNPKTMTGPGPAMMPEGEQQCPECEKEGQKAAPKHECDMKDGKHSCEAGKKDECPECDKAKKGEKHEECAECKKAAKK